ncbi:MAG: TatD family hydrolase [Planctomycetota bacterium]
MPYIDPHIHMVSRTTDDYADMAAAGCVAVTEPAFWAGYDRSHPEAFRDYFHELTEVEPRRAAQFGIDHFCWLCINPKEAEDPQFAREVIQLIPEFLGRPNVLGIGEIGLNRNTKNEMLILEEQLAFAAQHDQLVLVHTPHLEDKLKGTRLILDAIKRNGNLSPDRVLIDHAEEHTIDLILDAGYWAGLTLYPTTKCTPQRAADILECYGAERLWVNSAGDWGPSDPLSVPKFQRELLRRHHNPAIVNRVVMENPRRFLGQSANFTVTPSPRVAD